MAHGRTFHRPISTRFGWELEPPVCQGLWGRSQACTCTAVQLGPLLSAAFCQINLWVTNVHAIAVWRLDNGRQFWHSELFDQACCITSLNYLNNCPQIDLFYLSVYSANHTPHPLPLYPVQPYNPRLAYPSGVPLEPSEHQRLLLKMFKAPVSSSAWLGCRIEREYARVMY